MDTLLISVTALSLLMAAAMAIVVTKLLRDERRRSDARVAALSELATEPAPRTEPRSVRVPAPESRRFRLQAEDPEAADLPLKVDAGSDFRLKPEATKSNRPEATTRTMGMEERQSDVRSLFDEPQRSSPWGGRLAIIATILVVVGGGGWLFLHPRPGAQTSQAAATTAAGTAPLELLSLRHAQEAGGLTITGLVQNPRAGAPLARVVATAFAFGPDGTFIASGRAPIDVRSLGAGDESPFVVTIPVHGTVARYRVGFRAEDGTVIAHVDKRSETLAQK